MTNNPPRQRILAAILALPILIASPHAHPSTDPATVEVLQVRAYQGRELQAVVSGFAVNEQGAVLTSAHALRRAERFTVTLGEGRAEVVAELAWRDDGTDTALLNATGIGAAPLVFAAGGLAAGRRVNTAWRAADGRLLTASGALGVAGADAPYQHNAMVTADGYGAPLLDECGRVVGINRRKPGGWLGFAAPRHRDSDPEGVVFATAAPRLLALLAARGVAYQAHAGPCVSAEDVALGSAAAAQAEAVAAADAAAAAEDAAAQARLDAEQAQQRADLSAAEKAELQAQLERAVEAKEQAAAEAAQQAAAAEQAQAAADEAAAARRLAQDTAQRNRRMLFIGGGAAGLLALLVFIRRNRAARRRVAAAEAMAEDAERRAEGPDRDSRPGWSFIALADESGGETIADTVADAASESTGDFYIALAVLQDAEQGVRIGRNPESCDIVIAAPAVSREHCRVFLSDEQLMLEDLKSANGTYIGAQKLQAHAPAAIQTGDRVALGDIEFKVAHLECQTGLY